MKVRHKTLGNEVELIYGIVHEGQYIVEAGSVSGLSRAFDTEQWEVVRDKPPDHWQDVTGECDEALNGGIGLDQYQIVSPCKHGYRLRKVQVRLETSPVSFLGYGQSAFIVERKGE